jgi:hypothetical protein
MRSGRGAIRWTKRKASKKAMRSTPDQVKDCAERGC